MTTELLIQKEFPADIYSDMKKQFPPEELKTVETMRQLLSGDYYKFAIFYDNKEPVGYIFYLQNDFLLVDYVAVFERFHSKGYGSRILRSLFEKYSNLKGCFFEVEPENSDIIQTIKRMNFYKKLGCEILDFEYYFPNDIRELNLKLLYKSFDGNIPDKYEIKNQVKFVFDKLHSDVKNRKAALDLINAKN